MRMSRIPLLLFTVGALALGGCMRSQQAVQPIASPVAVAAMDQPPVIYAATPAYQPAPTSTLQPRGFFAYGLGGPFVRAPAPAPMVAPCSGWGCGAPAPVAYRYAAYPGAETPYLL